MERYKDLSIKSKTSVVPNSKVNKDLTIKCENKLMMETVVPLESQCGFKPETDKMSNISVLKLDLIYLTYLLDDNR